MDASSCLVLAFAYGVPPQPRSSSTAGMRMPCAACSQRARKRRLDSRSNVMHAASVDGRIYLSGARSCLGRAPAAEILEHSVNAHALRRVFTTLQEEMPG